MGALYAHTQGFREEGKEEGGGVGFEERAGGALKVNEVSLTAASGAVCVCG